MTNKTHLSREAAGKPQIPHHFIIGPVIRGPIPTQLLQPQSSSEVVIGPIPKITLRAVAESLDP
jgi:hypothetical protein